MHVGASTGYTPPVPGSGLRGAHSSPGAQVDVSARLTLVLAGGFICPQGAIRRKEPPFRGRASCVFPVKPATAGVLLSFAMNKSGFCGMLTVNIL